MKGNTERILRYFGIAATIIGTLVTNWVADRKMEEKIEEKLNEALAKREEEDTDDEA